MSILLGFHYYSPLLDHPAFQLLLLDHLLADRHLLAGPHYNFILLDEHSHYLSPSLLPINLRYLALPHLLRLLPLRSCPSLGSSADSEFGLLGSSQLHERRHLIIEKFL